MDYRHTIAVLAAGRIMVDCGPMRLVIQAFNNGQPQTEPAQKAAGHALTCLERVARLKKALSMSAHRIKNIPEDEIAVRMCRSVLAIGDADLTPMAAVAGTIADFVADRLYQDGMTKVVVDNGGDIAVRLRGKEEVTIGVRTDIRRQTISHVIRLDSRCASWGIATSGVGGRSFTRGIASAVTALAGTASMADAAATAIANACMVEDKQIIQVPAQKLDPNTDLFGIPVTVIVGALPADKIRLAIQKALQKAEYLSQKRIITGALIAAGARVSVTASMPEFLTVKPESIDEEDKS
jgi:ApbE superfamily uncharacterized protein (UPF0280 family)